MKLEKKDTIGNAMISSDYPPDSEGRGWLQWLGGIGRAVLGASRKFQNARQFTRINQRVILMDFSYGNLMAIAQSCPPMYIAISRGADMFANMRVRHLDKNGNDVKNSDILKLLNRPNPIDNTFNAFARKWYVHNTIYANTFIYENYGRSKQFRGTDLPSLLWVLPSGEIRIELSGQIYRQVNIEDIILEYKLFLDPQPFTPDEIIFIPNGISANGISAGNMMEALQIPLSNVQIALKSMNIILGDRGMIGYFTTDSKDEAGPIPLSNKVKKFIKDTYKRDNSVDSDQSHVGIFSQKTEFHPMTFDVEQLQILPMIEEVKAAICDALGLDRDIFSSTKGATFENKEQGRKQTYQNTMQPLADLLMSNLERRWGLDEKGETLVADYSWLPVMKEDELKGEQAKFQKSQACHTMLTDGVISHEQYAEIMEVEMDGTGEVLQQPKPTLPTNKEEIPK